MSTQQLPTPNPFQPGQSVPHIPDPSADSAGEVQPLEQELPDASVSGAKPARLDAPPSALTAQTDLSRAQEALVQVARTLIVKGAHKSEVIGRIKEEALKYSPIPLTDATAERHYNGAMGYPT